MKLLHVADLHLDSAFTGMQRVSSSVQKQLVKAPYQAFERCVSVAINQSVDVVVIAGDIYNAEQPSVYAQHFFVQQLERLNKANIPVVLVHGNHDFVRLSEPVMKYPENVHELRKDRVMSVTLTLKNNETLTCYGFSYTKRWVTEEMAMQFPVNHGESDYTIGIYHGALLQSEDNRYAPFTIEQLLSKHYDYWALGHIHQQLVLNDAPIIQYSGCIQGRHRNEVGDKGAFIVELHKGMPTISEFISLAPIVWQLGTIDCQSDWSIHDLMTQLQQIMTTYQFEAEATTQSQLITLTLNNAQLLSQTLQQALQSGEILSMIEPIISDELFVMIVALQPVYQQVVEPFEYDRALNASFVKAESFLRTSEGYEKIMNDLFKHSVMHQWFSDWRQNDEMHQELVDEATQLLVQSIGFDEENNAHEN